MPDWLPDNIWEAANALKVKKSQALSPKPVSYARLAAR